MTDSNYKQLQALQEKLEPQGFTVLAFPCNQFGGQEPGDAAKIRSFVDGYGVTFPMFAKIDVNGPNTHPVYKFLKKEKREFMGLTSDIKWNFAKFLVRRDGSVANRYLPTTSPSSIEKDILALLK
uniref:Glutathione peroxidase n=1 Tax=Chrysotila carterae TaxID=13221 RepID=A0A7S4F465_CHRCT|mmetsp:Transcript_50049/g.108459  ORF Transcript_50049/g.108459 Transcript_50049/m.108459 type:complete len:125 (-) Transcript_50049:745-1119(-)